MIRRLRVPGRDFPRRGITVEQRHKIAALADQAGVDRPAVVWYSDAVRAIKDLEANLEAKRQPQLEGMEDVA